MDSIRIHLSNYIVDSLRAMPEHCNLVKNWSAMLRAINAESSTNHQGDKASDRAEVAKQRVLVQMLAYAAQAEVGAVADEAFLVEDTDPDDPQRAHKSTAEKKPNRGSSKNKSDSSHEILSVSLMKALPDLMVKFKTDPEILKSICILPRYLRKFGTANSCFM